MKELIFPMKEQYQEYVTDESKFSGYAESISFPENEEEVAEIVGLLREKGIPLTIQGGKTGITGGAVPEGGHILNLSRMNRVKGSELLEDGTGRITIEPGINLIDLRNEINSLFRKTPLFWPPDPTETSASAGGIAAAGAQGIGRLLYGKSENYIESVRILDYDGGIRDIHTGESIFLPSGRKVEPLNTVLGKEGITGIITELTLKLIPKPESMWGIAFFFSTDEEAGEFAEQLKEDLPVNEAADIASVEYMDRETLLLIESRKPSMAKIKELPDIEEDVQAMIYIELHGSEEGIEELAEQLMELAAGCGSDPDSAWAVSGETDVDKLHVFRHAAAETSNLFIEEARQKDGRLTKLGADMSLAGRTVPELLSYYRTQLKQAGLRGCIFGHILENHLHVNVLPRDYEEYEQGRDLLRIWADYAREQKGSAVSEHGIGKLKRKLLNEHLPQEYLSLCSELRSMFPQNEKINQGNILEWKAGAK